MGYKIGEKVVHWNHGVGSVVAIEQINLSGVSKWYYVIEVEILKLWVPVDDATKGSLRYPLDSGQFTKHLQILRDPGEPLPDRYFPRKIALRERMQKRTVEGLCRIIRDLTDRARQHSLSPEDSSVLLAAENFLLDEWVVALGTERNTAMRELEMLLQ